MSFGRNRWQCTLKCRMERRPGAFSLKRPDKAGQSSMSAVFVKFLAAQIHQPFLLLQNMAIRGPLPEQSTPARDGKQKKSVFICHPMMTTKTRMLRKKSV